MLSILNGIQGLVNLLFFVAIVGTLVVSWIYASRLKKQYGANFPWSKTILIVGIEVILWAGFNFFWEIFEALWLPITIIAVVVIFLISRRKRRYV
jgi:phosphatidylserine synthase